MRLQKAQVEHLLSMISEGLKTDEINKRAATFDPTYQVSRGQVEQYRKTRKVQIAEIIKAGQVKGLTDGLATKEARVDLLKQLAIKMRDELMDDPEKFWLRQVKGIGQGENFQEIEYFEFNTSEVQQLRGVLDDIAQEVGHRIKNVDVKSNGEVIKGYVGFSPDDWDEQTKDGVKK
jgi:hypothetical protein